jgi:hypothetical protein
MVFFDYNGNMLKNGKVIAKTVGGGILEFPLNEHGYGHTRAWAKIVEMSVYDTKGVLVWTKSG